MIFKEEENQNKEKRILSMWATGVWGLKLDGKVRRERRGGFFSPRRSRRPVDPCREKPINPDQGRERGVSPANFVCFPVLPGMRPVFWSLLRTQLPVNTSSETRSRCILAHISPCSWALCLGKLLSGFSLELLCLIQRQKPGMESVQLRKSPRGTPPTPHRPYHCGLPALLPSWCTQVRPQGRTKPKHLLP